MLYSVYNEQSDENAQRLIGLDLFSYSFVSYGF